MLELLAVLFLPDLGEGWPGQSERARHRGLVPESCGNPLGQQTLRDIPHAVERDGPSLSPGVPKVVKVRDKREWFIL